MTGRTDHEERLSRLEVGQEQVAKDVAVARRLSAVRDGGLADLGVKVDANRTAINGLGLQTAGRFDVLEGRFDVLEGRFDVLEERFDVLEGRFDHLVTEMDRGFLEIRGRLDAAAAGQELVVGLLTRLIGDEPGSAEGA